MFDIDKVMEILHGTATVYGHLDGVGDYEICSTRELAEVLEKQIPKEPNKLGGASLCQCGRGVNFMDCDYCPSCGQKIKWG